MAKRSSVLIAAGRCAVILAALGVVQCLPAKQPLADGVSSVKDAGGGNQEPVNVDAMFQVLYEVQVRSANACRTDTGSPEQVQACAAKAAPKVKFLAESWAGGFDCENDQVAQNTLADLQKTRLGTFEDMLQDTDDYHVGITLKYIKQKVGVSTVWIMPVFMNNNRYNIPARCDNLGSPYAVRDYLHIAGSLSKVCIVANTDEFNVPEGDRAPCWGDVSFDRFMQAASQQGLRVMMDLALNHFGHNYRYYDYADYTPTRERIAANENLDGLWNFDATFEPGLVRPSIVDSAQALASASAASPTLRAAAAAVGQKCPNVSGDSLVRAVNMYRNMLDWERAQFKCDQPMYLEHQAPGFYAGAGGWNNKHPSRQLGDNFTNNWSDVKFLYHQELHASDDRGDFYPTFVRNREYFFRIMNYWASRGVSGFRLDHTTDGDSGMAPNEWRYLLRKVNYYDWVRKGRPADHHSPIYMAEEFGDQGGMARVVDAMTDGYIGDMRGGTPKDAAHVQRVFEAQRRFPDRLLIMRALEDHDEHRLYDGTGFDEWTGAGFFGLALTTRSLPALLMGQEFGERSQLSFRRSDFLRSRFVGNPAHFGQGQDLVNFYGGMIKGRLDGRNHALLSGAYAYLPLRNNQPNDPRIYAVMKWWGTDVIFAFHNLWAQGTVSQAFYIPPNIADGAGIQGGNRYRLVNVISGQQVGQCRSGDELKTNFFVSMDQTERLQWLRLELCP